MRKVFIALLFFLILSKPCFAAKMLGDKKLDIPLVSQVNETDYRINADNKLTLIYYLKNGSTEKYENIQILPSGKINIPRVGEQNVISLTTKDIEDLVEKNIETISKAIVFIHRTPNNISVLGEVKAPGSYSIENIKTVYDAIGKAQGFTKFANLRKVMLIRQRIDGTRISYMINFPKEVFKAYKKDSGVGKETYILQEGDIIYIKASKWKQFRSLAFQILNLATAGAITGASAGLVNGALN